MERPESYAKFEPSDFNFHELPSWIKEAWSEDPVYAKHAEYSWRNEQNFWSPKAK